MPDAQSLPSGTEIIVQLTREEADAICESWAGGKVDHRLLHGAIGKIEDALDKVPR